jgi:citrate lyase beta subunit
VTEWRLGKPGRLIEVSKAHASAGGEEDDGDRRGGGDGTVGAAWGRNRAESGRWTDVTLGPQAYARLDQALTEVDAQLARDYPGESGTRQPVHTVYVPADRFTADLPRDWSAQAMAALEEHLPDPATLAGVLGVAEPVAAEVLPRLRAKLTAEPIEDLRIDFEDGYGTRPDAEEDAAAERAGRQLTALALPFGGLRCKGLEPTTRHRGVRTLDLFLGALLADRPASPRLPAGFAVTLPKVTHAGQVTAFAELCAELERVHGLPGGELRFELQIETPQAILAADGTAAVAGLLRAAAGRVTGLHYGTYDYSAACGVAAPYQSLAHPVADHAKAVMQVAAAGTGVWLSDGSTNVLPVGPPDAVLAAWRLHARLVRRSLERGYYQGWDLHPGQLVTRYGATYGFYREGMPAACDRLRNYLANAADGVLDEPATAQAMASLLVRGLHCGALDEPEVSDRAGLSAEVLYRLFRRRIG